MRIATLLARWSRLRASLPAPRPLRFTAAEVRALLGPEGAASPARRAAVLAVAAVPAAWLDHVSTADSELTWWLMDRLPTLVYLYTCGASAEAMSARLGGRGAWAIERALDTACAAIAARLNRG